MRTEMAKARQEDDTELVQMRAKLADVDLRLDRLVKAVGNGVDLSAAQGRINERSQELQSLKVRLAELEKQRERTLRMPAITDAAVDDVLQKIAAMLDTTDPKELEAILAHFIEKIEISGERATFYYTFNGPETQNMRLDGDPEGSHAKSQTQSYRSYASLSMSPKVSSPGTDALEGEQRLAGVRGASWPTL